LIWIIQVSSIYFAFIIFINFEDKEFKIPVSEKKKENTFILLNSDIICKFPLEQMLDFHLKHEGMGTILVSEVDQPELYGVVVHDKETKQISEFKEKPKEFVGNHINAGITMLDLRLIQYLELKNLSIGK
jgi:mannose-1-phosphate guanylyltransferase